MRRPRDEVVASLFDEHYSGLCRLAFLLVDDRSLAEEIVQEAFLRTFAGWRRIRHVDRAQWYLRTAVLNLSRSRGRRKTTEERANRRSASGSSDISTFEDASNQSLTVLGAVRRLPPRQREAIVLRYYGDLSEAEIAGLLRCSLGTVKSQLAKARASLAETLRA